MRKIIILAGIAAMAAITGAWSPSAWAEPRTAGKIEPTEASAPISPHHIMVTHGTRLPIEEWTDPF